MLEKRFSHGVQFQAAYTFNKSLDWASSFEETLNPLTTRRAALSRCLTPRIGSSSATFRMSGAQIQGIKGKILDDWELFGITQFQSGFPIRLQTQDDEELIGSLFFFGTGAPQITGTVRNCKNPKVYQTFQSGQPEPCPKGSTLPGCGYLPDSYAVRRSYPGHICYHAALNLLWSRAERVGHHVLEKFRLPRPVTSSSVRMFSICSTKVSSSTRTAIFRTRRSGRSWRRAIHACSNLL